jgi:hypothetical protein
MPAPSERHRRNNRYAKTAQAAYDAEAPMVAGTENHDRGRRHFFSYARFAHSVTVAFWI